MPERELVSQNEERASAFISQAPEHLRGFLSRINNSGYKGQTNQEWSIQVSQEIADFIKDRSYGEVAIVFDELGNLGESLEDLRVESTRLYISYYMAMAGLHGIINGDIKFDDWP